MKKIIILVFASLLVTTLNASGKYDKEIKDCETQIEKLNLQKSKISTRYEKAVTDYEEAAAKIEALAEKPKSPAYKTAQKKLETSLTKKEETEQEIKVIECKIDSINGVIQSYLDKIEADRIAAEEQEKLKQEEIKRQEEEKLAAEKKRQEAEEKASKESNKTSSINAKSSKSKEDNSEPMSKFETVLVWIGIIIFGGLFIWIVLKRALRCPRCGRWFTMQKAGVKVLNRQKDGNGWVISYRKSFKCSNCGYVKTEDGKLYTSRKDLPASWY